MLAQSDDRTGFEIYFFVACFAVIVSIFNPSSIPRAFLLFLVSRLFINKAFVEALNTNVLTVIFWVSFPGCLFLATILLPLVCCGTNFLHKTVDAHAVCCHGYQCNLLFSWF